MNVERRRLMPVIVRAWGDEPVRLFLHNIENNRCYVGQEYAKRPLSLPVYEVFAFDSHRFSTMRQAYESGDSAKLASLYASINMDDFACNRYQDNVSSMHGQENISDSERIAGRDGQ
jgi:hypothetical protein